MKRQGRVRQACRAASEQETLFGGEQQWDELAGPTKRLPIHRRGVHTAPLLAQSQESTGGATATAVISSVAVMQASQSASVRVEGEGRLEPRAARMQNPDRLVLDFAGTRMAVQKTIIPGVSAPVRGVRLGQYRPDVARVPDPRPPVRIQTEREHVCRLLRIRRGCSHR